MNKNENLILSATNEFGDYFSRLGGSTRPSNMPESDIHLYILCKLLELLGYKFMIDKYLDNTFMTAAIPALKKVKFYLSNISLKTTEIIPFIKKYFEYADLKLKDYQKSDRWESFRDFINNKLV